jgi:hypothetical protein
MNIELNQEQMNDVKAMLADVPKGAMRATTRAINHTLGTTKTMAATEIGQRINLTQTRIKQDLAISKATFSNPSGRIDATGEPVSLTSFSKTYQTLKGVSVQVLTTTGRVTIRHAFIAVAHNSEQAFWRNYSGARKPLRKPQTQYAKMPEHIRYPGGHLERLTGPRIEDIYSRPEVIGAVVAKAGVKLHERLDYETNYLFEQYKQKIYGAD